MRAKDILSAAACRSLASCVLASFLVACATMPKVQTLTLAEQPDCDTSMEGVYGCKDTWIGGTPALVLETTRGSKRSRNSKGRQIACKTLVGRIISTDENGVTFSTAEAGSSPDSESVYYTYDQIVALIDEDGETVYGEAPDRYSSGQTMELWLKLGKQYYGDSPTHKIVLQPNEPFSFCLPGGTYDVTGIFFKDGNNNVCRGIDYPPLTITLTRGYANYIGHIYISLPKKELADSLYVPMGFVIPYERMSGPGLSELALFGALVGGVVGGAIGAALDASSGDSGEQSGEKKALIAIDKNFQPRCKSLLKQNIIEVKKHLRSN